MDYEYLSNLIETHVIDMAAAGHMYCCVRQPISGEDRQDYASPSTTNKNQATAKPAGRPPFLPRTIFLRKFKSWRGNPNRSAVLCANSKIPRI
jgi:hypothetical protein